MTKITEPGTAYTLHHSMTTSGGVLNNFNYLRQQAQPDPSQLLQAQHQLPQQIIHPHQYLVDPQSVAQNVPKPDRPIGYGAFGVVW